MTNNSDFKGDLEKILKHKNLRKEAAEQETSLCDRMDKTASPSRPHMLHDGGSPSKQVSTVQCNDDVKGITQSQRMVPPAPNSKPNMLTKEMAEAAALKYKRDKRRIQKACAKVDNPNTNGGCACVLL